MRERNQPQEPNAIYSVEQREQVVPAERKIIIMNSPGEEDTAPRSITIFGSNNILGNNIFLVNTNAEQEDLEKLIQSLPPEFMDKFIKAMGTVIQQRNYHQDGA